MALGGLLAMATASRPGRAPTRSCTNRSEAVLASLLLSLDRCDGASPGTAECGCEVWGKGGVALVIRFPETRYVIDKPLDERTF